MPFFPPRPAIKYDCIFVQDRCLSFHLLLLLLSFVFVADISHVSPSHLFAISFIIASSRGLRTVLCCSSFSSPACQTVTKPRDITLLRLIDTHNRFASSSVLSSLLVKPSSIPSHNIRVSLRSSSSVLTIFEKRSSKSNTIPIQKRPEQHIYIYIFPSSSSSHRQKSVDPRGDNETNEEPQKNTIE